MVLRAFAEALLPGAGALPCAEGGGVEVVEPLAAHVRHVSPRVRLAIRLALTALELSCAPRRFSSLPVERRAARLARIEASRDGPLREAFVLLKAMTAIAYARDTRVTAAVGVAARCRVAGDGARPAAAQLEPEALEAPEGVERCDVVIVGSGAGGAAAARALAERGLDVIVVEQGPYLDAGSYSRDPLAALATLYRDGGLTVAEGRPPVPLPLGRCVGGTTVINSGTCFRTPDDVLARWRDGLGISWAADLEGEFEALERDLEVRPVDPERAGRNAALCRAGAEAIGASNGPIARNAGDVVCCGTCPLGCELDAKRAVHVSELPHAVAAGCRVRARVRVERVIVAGGTAAGVECTADGGRRYEVRARAVVVAAGAIGTPELLLRQGLGSASGQLGRNLMVHPACWVGARFDEEVRGWDGVMQSWFVDEWHDRGLFLEATFTPLAFGAPWLPGTGEAFAARVERYGNLAIIGVHMSDRASAGRVRVTRRGRARITYALGAPDAAAIGFGIARAAEIHFAAGAREVYPQLAGLTSLPAGTGARAIDARTTRPRDLRLEAFHPMGTARMGADPRQAVVAPSGQMHGVPGLYVADASIFPTSLRVNPMITIMACARHIAAGLAGQLA